MAKLADLNVNIGAKTDDFSKGLKDVQKETNALSSGIGKVGGLIAGAFAVGSVVSFASEVSKLAAAAEGVEIAFKRIGGDSILGELREATKGTVNDLELMKAAVQASNFKIPLEQLGGLLKFAHQRAKDTGQSVDYLVQSIILGIGRKSPLILDNLGISAVSLKEKMKGVASETASVGDVAKAVGEIATEEMSKIGEAAETTAEKTAQVAASWDNFKVGLGEFVNVIVAKLSPAITKLLENMELGLKRVNDVIKDAKGTVLQNSTANALKYVDDMSASFQRRGMDSAKAQEKAFQLYFEGMQAQIKTMGSQSVATNTDHIMRRYRLLKAELAEVQKIYAQRKEQAKVEAEINAAKANSKAEKPVPRDSNWWSGLWSDRAMKQSSGVSSTKITARPEYASQQEAAMTNILGAVNGKLPTDEIEGFATTWEKAGNNILNVTQTISDGITNFVVEFSEAIGNLIAGTGSWDDVGQAVLKNVGNFMSSLGKQMIALGTAKVVTDTLLATPGGGFAAIAMGAALVAMGSAVNSSFSSSPMSGGSKGVSRSSYSNVGSGSMTLEVVGVTRGEDIYWSQKRTEQRLNNTSPRTR